MRSTTAKKLFQADAGESLKNLLTFFNTNLYSPALESWLAEQPIQPLAIESYLKLWADWDNYKIKFLTLFQQYDAIFSPVAPQCALPHGQTLEAQMVWSLIRYTASITLTECPVVTLPCGKNAGGFPIGIQIITKPWADELALSIAELLENALQ